MVPREEIMPFVPGCATRFGRFLILYTLIKREVYLGFRLLQEGLDRAVQAEGVLYPGGYTVGIKDPADRFHSWKISAGSYFYFPAWPQEVKTVVNTSVNPECSFMKRFLERVFMKDENDSCFYIGGSFNTDLG
ncbi:hypothetical protein [Desulfotruncus alcoholivorax]|uniref:hypothetical protein n=1 Tax=Desulfotruncus alcoholivorax TaxID=265477 RepID=UPI0004890FF7|nr:hypothetical protein [Desulfotruncus alcoholivorax]